jgi:hypothetical protein
MDHIPEQLYKKLKQVTFEVKSNLLRRGIAIPVKNNDGSISIGNYTVKKSKGYYQITDFTKEVIVDKINLPQSAIILANGLALGKFIDKDLLSKDRHYGYAAFEEELHRQSAIRNLKKNIDRADLLYTKSAVNKSKKDNYKKDILGTFEKLKKFA